MVLVDGLDSESAPELSEEPFPPEVEFMISALEAGRRPPIDRQRLKRTIYRVRASLRLFSDAIGTPATLLYTRHVNSHALGFLTDRHLTLSHGGIIRLRSPQGRILQIACTVLRCREAARDWYEGAVYFNRDQAVFAAENMP